MKRFHFGRRHFLRGTKGMSAVEMALVLPVLLWFISGIIDFGNLYLQCNIASEAAREGARMAALNPAGSPNVKTKDDIETFIQSKYGAQLTVDMDPTTATADNPVTVTVSNPITFLTPGIKAMFASDFKVRGQTVMQAERNS